MYLNFTQHFYNSIKFDLLLQIELCFVSSPRVGKQTKLSLTKVQKYHWEKLHILIYLSIPLCIKQLLNKTLPVGQHQRYCGELPALSEEDDNPYHPQRLLKVGYIYIYTYSRALYTGLHMYYVQHISLLISVVKEMHDMVKIACYLVPYCYFIQRRLYVYVQVHKCQEEDNACHSFL